MTTIATWQHHTLAISLVSDALAAPRVLGASDPMPDSISIDSAACRRLNIWGPGCEARSAAFHRLVARAFETRGVWLAQRPDQRLWVPGVGHQFGDW